MIRLIFTILIAAVLSARGADKPMSVTIDDRHVDEIRSVTLGRDGKISILYSGGGIKTTFDKLPDGFLAAWGIKPEALDKALVESARNKSRSEAEDLELAIRRGLFREVEGVVYDLRKAQPDWTSFKGGRIFQKLDHGGVLIGFPPAIAEGKMIVVMNLPNANYLTDTDVINFSAKVRGTITAINPGGGQHLLRAYDAGRPCPREEIPEEVLNGTKLFASLQGEMKPPPVFGNGDEPRGNGTGFFITEDGYLVTNNHVVEHARKLKVRCTTGTFDALVIKTNAQNDLALLKVNGHFKALPVDYQDASLGLEVFTIGFPNIDLQGISPKYTDGRISSLSGLRDDPREYQISVPVQPGNSGGPLVDKYGAVVGVIVARISDEAAFRTSGALPQNVNYAIKSNRLKDLLSTVNISKTGKPQLKGDVIQSVQDSVAVVLIY